MNRITPEHLSLAGPGGASRTRFSPCSTKWQRLSFWICFRSTEGW